jgi:hypothetical protein
LHPLWYSASSKSWERVGKDKAGILAVWDVAEREKPNRINDLIL